MWTKKNNMFSIAIVLLSIPDINSDPSIHSHWMNTSISIYYFSYSGVERQHIYIVCLTVYLTNIYCKDDLHYVTNFCYATRTFQYIEYALWWRNNDHDSVSNHQPHECLFNRLFRPRSKKTSKLRVTGLCVGNSPAPVNSPHKGPVTRKMFPFDDVIMVEAGFDAISSFRVFLFWSRVYDLFMFTGWPKNETNDHAVQTRRYFGHNTTRAVTDCLIRPFASISECLVSWLCLR